ncbi:hypothetical protein [Streptomyces sp. NPDC002215]
MGVDIMFNCEVHGLADEAQAESVLSRSPNWSSMNRQYLDAD